MALRPNLFVTVYTNTLYMGTVQRLETAAADHYLISAPLPGVFYFDFFSNPPSVLLYVINKGPAAGCGIPQGIFR